MYRWFLGPLLAALALACSGEDPGVALEVPAIGASHLLIGTGAAGRAIPPSALVVRKTEDVAELRPELIGGTEVDMVVAGLDAADLPAGLTPDNLRFVADRDPDTRGLPPLYEPHVLLRPSPPESPERLVPVSADGLNRDDREERSGRLERLLEGVAIASECRAAAVPVTVTTPRTSADAILSMHTMSDRSVLVGFSLSSTIAVGVIAPGGSEIDVVPVPLAQEVLQPGEVSEIVWVSDEEVDVAGRQLPASMTVDIVGGIGTTGVHIVWSEARQRYVDDTPQTDATFPRRLRGMVRLSLDGEPSLCGFGAVLGSDRSAAVWCRTETSTTWRVSLDLDRAFNVTTVVARPNEAHLAVDLAGTVYEYAGEGRWVTVLETALNTGCSPPCAALSAAAATPDAGNLLAVIGGARAQLLLIEDSPAGVIARRPEAIDPALFADERTDAQDALRFSSITRAPDGALWVADATPTLFRLTPQGDRLDRVCLPDEMRDVPISSLEAHPDGRLLIGMSPALLGTGDWRMP